MATYRQIYMTFWTDPKVDEDFTPEDKYFYLYLITNPHTNICGCYEVGYRQMARETGYNEDTIKRLIERFKTIHKVIDYSEEYREMLIINWHKYNWSNSDKLISGVEKASSAIKNPHFKEYIDSVLASDDRVSIGYTYTMDTSVTDTVTVPIHKKSNKRCGEKREEFVPPTFEDVKAYCAERGNKVDAQHFYDYFTAGNWKDSKGNAVKNWKQKLITWEKFGGGSNVRKSTGKDAGGNKERDTEWHIESLDLT